MAVTDKKRNTGKANKKTSRPKLKFTDLTILKFDAELRSAKSMLAVFKKILQQSATFARMNKMEKNNYMNRREERLMRKFMAFGDPICVKPSDEVPPLMRYLTVAPKVKVAPKAVVPHATPPSPRNNISITLTGLLTVFNQEYRKSPLSKLYKPTFDLLPSPAMFSLYINAHTEGTRYLQELALDSMDRFVKAHIDKVGTVKHVRKTDDILKFCIQCNVDFTAMWSPIDSKKTRFLCEKCMIKKRRSEWSKFDVMSLYKDGVQVDKVEGDPPPQTVQYKSAPSAPNLIRTALPPAGTIVRRSLHPPLASTSIRPESIPKSESFKVSIQKPIMVDGTIRGGAPISPRLMVSTANQSHFPPYAQTRFDGEKRGIVTTANTSLQPVALHHTARIPNSAPLRPYFVPLNSYSQPGPESIHKLSTVHYRPQKENRVSMRVSTQLPLSQPRMGENITPTLVRAPPTLGAPISRSSVNTPGLRLVRVPVEYNVHGNYNRPALHPRIHK